MSETIELLYFAGIREALGRGHDELPLTALPTPTIDGLWRWLATQHPDALAWSGFVRVAVNEAFPPTGADPTTLLLRPGDTIALIPPVSGGTSAPPPEHVSDPTGRLVLTRRPLDPAAVEALVLRPEAGGVVTFSGRVRDHTADHAVSSLDYDAYPPMVLKKLAEVVAEATDQWPPILAAVHHRWGHLTVGEVAVVISVSSPHRAEAFAACQHIIDRLKQEVPIWKKETGPEGDEWVGFGP